MRVCVWRNSEFKGSQLKKPFLILPNLVLLLGKHLTTICHLRQGLQQLHPAMLHGSKDKGSCSTQLASPVGAHSPVIQPIEDSNIHAHMKLSVYPIHATTSPARPCYDLLPPPGGLAMFIALHLELHSSSILPHQDVIVLEEYAEAKDGDSFVISHLRRATWGSWSKGLSQIPLTLPQR